MRMLRVPPHQARGYGSDGSIREPLDNGVHVSEPILAGRDQALAGSAERTGSVRWALASLSLSMLLSSLGTSIANVALPNLAQAFSASFQAVQWIVLAYLLAVTTLIVSVGRPWDI